MAINRFSTPVESEYISLYVPIPFEQLYALGKEYNTRLDKAYELMASHIEKYKDFQSPSAVDTARWNQIMLTNVIDRVNKLMSNPDALKTQAGRAEILNIINSMPYGEMNELKQSRDLMLLRLKLEQQLSLAGKYNPLWHGMNYTNYSTDKQGVFNDLNLVPYMSEVDLVEPYVSSLKDSFLYSDGSYDYTGVLPETTDAQLRENMSAIYNTPLALMHIKSLMKQGLSEEDAKKTFENSIYLAGRLYARKNREANAFAQILKTYEYKNKDNTPQGSGLLYLTDAVEITGLENYNRGVNAYISNTEQYAKIREQLQSEDPVIREQAKKDLQLLQQMNTPDKIFKNILKAYSYTPNGIKSFSTLNNQLLPSVINSIIDNFGYYINNAEAANLLLKNIPGISLDTQTTPFGKRRVISGGVGYELMSDVIADIAKVDLSSMSMDKLRQHLSAGDFTNMIVLSNNRTLTIPINSNNNTRGLSYQEVNVALSDKDIKRLGLSDYDMITAGAKVLTTLGKKSSTTTVGESGELNKDEEKKNRKYNQSTSQSATEPEKYWVISLANKIPLSGEGVDAEFLNQDALKLNMSSSGYTEQYPGVQLQSY